MFLIKKNLKTTQLIFNKKHTGHLSIGCGFKNYSVNIQQKVIS